MGVTMGMVVVLAIDGQSEKVVMPRMEVIVVMRVTVVVVVAVTQLN